MSAELHVPKKFRRFLHGIHYRKRLLDAAEIHVLRRKWLFESVMLLQELVIWVFFCPTSRIWKAPQQSGYGQQQNLLFCPSQKAKVLVQQRRR